MKFVSFFIINDLTAHKNEMKMRFIFALLWKKKIRYPKKKRKLSTDDDSTGNNNKKKIKLKTHYIIYIKIMKGRRIYSLFVIRWVLWLDVIWFLRFSVFIFCDFFPFLNWLKSLMTIFKHLMNDSLLDVFLKSECPTAILLQNMRTKMKKKRKKNEWVWTFFHLWLNETELKRAECTRWGLSKHTSIQRTNKQNCNAMKYSRTCIRTQC